MSLQDDIDILDPADDVQAAYDNSIGSKWTIRRKAAAMSMGIKVLLCAGPELQSLRDNETYSNSYRDTIWILWLCECCSVDKVNEILASKNPRPYQDEANDWGEKEGIEYGSSRFFEGYKLITDTIVDILRSAHSAEQRSVPFRTNGTGTRPVGKSRSRSRPPKHREKEPSTS